MSGRIVIRVQDRFGRGPYRPGVPAQWSDPNGFDCPPWWIELGIAMEDGHASMNGPYHFGCAFQSRSHLDRWFTGRELRSLDRLGYRLAAVQADIVLFETPRQIVFGSSSPLSSPLRSCRLTSRVAERIAA